MFQTQQPHSLMSVWEKIPFLVLFTSFLFPSLWFWVHFFPPSLFVHLYKCIWCFWVCGLFLVFGRWCVGLLSPISPLPFGLPLFLPVPSPCFLGFFVVWWNLIGTLGWVVCFVPWLLGFGSGWLCVGPLPLFYPTFLGWWLSSLTCYCVPVVSANKFITFTHWFDKWQNKM